MVQAAVSVLKAKLSAYLNRVKRGDEVLVTEHGKPIARLVAVPEPARRGGPDDLTHLYLAGLARPGRPGGVRPSLLKPPKFKDPGGAVLKALLEERRRGP
ncbi:MAG: type II toxin-antitoxin system prevent-host-death family antitoxin [bacterium]